MLVERSFIPAEDSLIKAFVHKQDENGRDQLGTGANAGMVTPAYGSFKAMRRYFLDLLPDGNYHVEVFHNWDKRFGSPDLDIVYRVGLAEVVM
jgi:hypothetical protein